MSRVTQDVTQDTQDAMLHKTEQAMWITVLTRRAKNDIIDTVSGRYGKPLARDERARGTEMDKAAQDKAREIFTDSLAYVNCELGDATAAQIAVAVADCQRRAAELAKAIDNPLDKHVVSVLIKVLDETAATVAELRTRTGEGSGTGKEMVKQSAPLLAVFTKLFHIADVFNESLEGKAGGMNARYLARHLFALCLMWSGGAIA